MVAVSRKKAAPGKRTARKRKAARKRIGALPIGRIVTVLGLMLLLAFSMGAVGYVIFFRTVLV